MSNRPTAVADYCGIGGLSLGSEQAGFNNLLAIDFDTHACASHALNFPQTKMLQRDRFLMTGEDILEELQKQGVQKGELDLYHAGAPCQCFSVENNNRSQDDPRIQLLLNLPRDIDFIKPRSFVLENVPQLLNEQAWPRMIENLNALKDYKWGYKKLRALDYNAPTLRTKVFVNGIRRDVCDVSDEVLFPAPTTRDYEALKIKNVLPHILYFCPGRKQQSSKMKNADGYATTVLKGKSIKVVDRNGVKRWLTAEEAKLLQGFPADFLFYGNSETENYARIGNAVPPPLARAVFEHIRKIIQR